MSCAPSLPSTTARICATHGCTTAVSCPLRIVHSSSSASSLRVVDVGATRHRSNPEISCIAPSAERAEGSTLNTSDMTLIAPSLVLIFFCFLSFRSFARILTTRGTSASRALVAAESDATCSAAAPESMSIDELAVLSPPTLETSLVCLTNAANAAKTSSLTGSRGSLKRPINESLTLSYSCNTRSLRVEAIDLTHLAAARRTL